MPASHARIWYSKYRVVLYKHQWNTRWVLRENMISSHVKITCYLHMWKDHLCYGYLINHAFSQQKASKVKWFGISLVFIQGFWYFARSRSQEIQVNPRNRAKFTKTPKKNWNSVEILSNTCLYNIFETYFSYRGYLLAVNLQIYLGSSSLKHANNIPK